MKPFGKEGDSPDRDESAEDAYLARIVLPITRSIMAFAYKIPGFGMVSTF